MWKTDRDKEASVEKSRFWEAVENQGDGDSFMVYQKNLICKFETGEVPAV